VDLEDTGQQLSMTSPTPTLSSSTEGCRWGWAQGGYGGGGARAGGGCGAGLAGGEIKEQMPGGVRLGTPWDKCQGWGLQVAQLRSHPESHFHHSRSCTPIPTATALPTRAQPQTLRGVLRQRVVKYLKRNPKKKTEL